jgi:hypothetical protein
MTKFEIGTSEIESIPKRLEMVMNSFTDHPALIVPNRRSGGTTKRKGIGISRKSSISE